MSIKRIQTSIIHIPPCSQEIIDNENPIFLFPWLPWKEKQLLLPWQPSSLISHLTKRHKKIGFSLSPVNRVLSK
jgi:hypothetical protein